MKKELEDKIFNEFPHLFRYEGDLRNSLMSFGFECGDGWFDIIYELAKKINIEWEKLNEEDQKTCYVQQVKEKFASLRWYQTLETKAMTKAIQQAEHKSEKTCEDCGNPGSTKGTGWFFTLCDVCNDARELRKKVSHTPFKYKSLVIMINNFDQEIMQLKNDLLSKKGIDKLLQGLERQADSFSKTEEEQQASRKLDSYNLPGEVREEMAWYFSERLKEVQGIIDAGISKD
jgi:hypothetical protein